MKPAGLGLQLAGWMLVILALALLPHAAERTTFVVGGLVVTLLGLGLLVRAHRDGGME